MNNAGVKPTKVILLVTFHFAYSNLDVHKTEKIGIYFLKNHGAHLKIAGDDRILMLFSAGHVPLLKQCFETNPDFEYVDFY